MTIEARLALRKDAFELNVEFAVPAEGITALFGPSGSGKTLTLRAMAGLDRASGGFVRVGEDIWQDGDLWVPTHERGVGYVFQEPSLLAHLSVRQNLDYAFRRVPKKARRFEPEGAASLFGVTQLFDRRSAGLSGGERQRVAMARALVSSPRILFMDEPLASLDLRSRNEILPSLERLRDESGIPVIYVSHSTDEVAHLADQMVLMENGTVRADGPIQTMLTRLDLPLAHGRDAEALIDTTVSSSEPEDGLTALDFAGGKLMVPDVGLEPGRSVRVRMRASDVSITLERHGDTSIQNILPATIAGMTPDDGVRITVGLDVGGVPILARVTRHSATRLGLSVGKTVFAQVKSVALRA